MPWFKRQIEKENHLTLLSYKGRLTFPLIHTFIENVEVSMEDTGVSTRSKKKIFNVLVEVFQNLTHYIDPSNESLDDESIKMATLKVWIEDDRCYIATGNYIANQKVSKLSSWLTKINSLDIEGVRKLYKEILTNNKFTEKGGGGLGFIDITKKSGNKLTFEFEKVNEKFSYFNFESVVDIEYN